MTGHFQSFSPAVAAATDAGVGEAFCTSGTSPTHGTEFHPVRSQASSLPATLHLVGPGSVGQAFLRMLPNTPLRLIGITDRSASVCARGGLDPEALSDLKASGGSLSSLSRSETLPVDLAIDLARADIVVDATPTSIDDPAAHAAARRNLRVLRRGGCLALAAKDTLCLSAMELLSEENRERVGIHAVLGGTGRALLEDIDELRRDCDEIAVVGNASTTAVLEVVERGGTIEEGIRIAQQNGVLEPDPELDLSGRDAAVKLVSVASAVWGGRVRVEDVVTEHLCGIDADAVKQRPGAGLTTRLVARCRRGGGLRVSFEAISRSSALAVPSTHVAYTYGLRGGRTRVHVGHGIGPEHTASALLRDVQALASRRSLVAGAGRLS